MHSAVMLISGILGWGLGWNGGLAPESCKSYSDFWVRDFTLMGILGLNTDLNWSVKAFAFAVSGKRVWPSFLKGAVPLESCLECFSSVNFFGFDLGRFSSVLVFLVIIEAQDVA